MVISLNCDSKILEIPKGLKFLPPPPQVKTKLRSISNRGAGGLRMCACLPVSVSVIASQWNNFECHGWIVTKFSGSTQLLVSCCWLGGFGPPGPWGQASHRIGLFCQNYQLLGFWDAGELCKVIKNCKTWGLVCSSILCTPDQNVFTGLPLNSGFLDINLK